MAWQIKMMDCSLGAIHSGSALSNGFATMHGRKRIIFTPDNYEAHCQIQRRQYLLDCDLEPEFHQDSDVVEELVLLPAEAQATYVSLQACNSF